MAKVPTVKFIPGALLIALALSLTACSSGKREGPADPSPGEKPRLVVLLIFDQLRGDYLWRWEELYGRGGFRRLTREGVWFLDCHYPYTNTITGPGHATI